MKLVRLKVFILGSQNQRRSPKLTNHQDVPNFNSVFRLSKDPLLQFANVLPVMFVLTELQDTLRVPPESLSIPLQDAITKELAHLYFDKVLKDLGLCVTLYDISNVEGGSVFPGDGAPHFTVDYRLVMFRPFVVSLGSFFEDIHIPEHLLQQPSEFNEEEKLWVWNYNGTDMFMDLDEDVRFRVVQVKYPTIPVEQEKDARPFAPMSIGRSANGV